MRAVWSERSWKLAIVVATGLTFGMVARENANASDSLGKKIGDFSLQDSAGNRWSWNQVKGKKAVVVLFIGTQCPINNSYMPRLIELNKEFVGNGVQFLAINANPQDSPKRIAEHVKKYGLTFPVLKDGTQKIAEQFAAKRTPEAFVLDSGGTIRYQGRIDDEFGISIKRPKPSRRDLAIAIEEVLAGKKVSQPTTRVAGCLITRSPKPKSKATVTFAKHVSRILQNNCQQCHRPNQIGPMALISYQDAVGWSEMIKEVVEENRMPPWHADPKHGKFANDRRLSRQDKETLLAWIKQGCPKGEPKDLPSPKEFPKGWRIGKPDQVFTMGTTVKVPARALGGIRYKFFFVPTRFTEDKWVVAAEAKPGNQAVVHHILVYIFKPGQRQLRGPDGIGQGLLVAYAPGDMPAYFGDNLAKKIPKGSSLVFQLHYTPSGSEQLDQSSVGLIFAKKPPQHQVRTRAIAHRRLRIPPGEENHKVTSSSTFPKDTILFSLMPHMHLRGKSFSYRVIFPDGRSELLLSVPRYDFGWQSNYRLAKPLRMPAGTRIECTAYFDNSKQNPNNPDPRKEVRWGDQTWHEMMIGFVDYALVDGEKGS